MIALLLTALPLLQSDAGAQPPPSGDPPPFTARATDYRVVDRDTALQIWEQPVFRDGRRELRASWLVAWFDRPKLERRAKGLGPDVGDATDRMRAELEDVQAGDAPSLFQRFRQFEQLALAEEIYLEGPIQYIENGRPVGQAGAIYFDLVEGRGWIAEAAISAERSIKGQMTTMRLLADWVRHSADGNMRAQGAVVTSCGFDDPHYHVRSNDLRITPETRDEDDELVFDVELRDNEIRLSDSFAIPLPRISYPAGEDFSPKYERLRLGNSARFGTFAEAELNGDAGRLGERIAKIFGDAPDLPRGRTKLKLRWLGSRGILLDGRLRFRETGRYNWDLSVGGLPDRGEDRGVIRVDESQRNTARLWYRSRGRFFLDDDDEWVDLSFTSQTDPGVQAEFWERDFLRYEHRDNYLHWRKADDAWYYDATALLRVDSFRTEVEELPRLGLARFASELFRIGDQPIVYSTRTTAAYLERVEGRATFGPVVPEDGFEEPFADGLGERQVARFDSSHRIEAPFSLGFAGLRAVPFVEARGTTWDRGVNVDDSPTRLASFGGLRLATTLWKRRHRGGMHEITPFVEVRQEVKVRQSDGVPVRFDQVDDAIDGNQYELGLRTRWLEPDGYREADFEVKSTYLSDRAGSVDRWLPVEVFGRLSSQVWGLPYGFVQDSRYDLDAHETVYSFSALAVRFSRNWTVELSHIRGRDATGTPIFEAASVGSRFRWTPKWEFEGSVSFPILSGGEDVRDFTIRRFGHDFVFELEFQDRTGEGGASVGVGFRPLLGWREPTIGLLRE